MLDRRTQLAQRTLLQLASTLTGNAAGATDLGERQLAPVGEAEVVRDDVTFAGREDLGEDLLGRLGQGSLLLALLTAVIVADDLRERRRGAVRGAHWCVERLDRRTVLECLLDAGPRETGLAHELFLRELTTEPLLRLSLQS